MAEKFQYFNGRKFTRDDNTGYYLCSTKSSDGNRKRMHVYVWEYYNGPVPEGYHVHHIDGDKSNNDIANLRAIERKEHNILHGKLLSDEERKKRKVNMQANVMPKAKKWHGSQTGHMWHKKHYESMKDKLLTEREFVCEYCGIKFISTQARSRFCSNKCRAADRRKSGVDDVIKICEDCGGEYTANKYRKTKYCPLCKGKKRPRNRAG